MMDEKERMENKRRPDISNQGDNFLHQLYRQV